MIHSSSDATRWSFIALGVATVGFALFLGLFAIALIVSITSICILCAALVISLENMEMLVPSRKIKEDHYLEISTNSTSQSLAKKRTKNAQRS
jgi:hypothetical protein